MNSCHEPILVPFESPRNFKLGARSWNPCSGAEAAKLKKLSDGSGFKIWDAEAEISRSFKWNGYISTFLIFNF
jgi:hypothetical protein